MSRQSLLTGTLVLATASTVNRVIGFVYQIFLIRLIRAEGIGLFNMVFPLYVLALVIASLGIPVAVAKLVSDAVTQKEYGKAYRILRLSLLYTIVSSLLVTLAVMAAASFVSGRILSNPETRLPFVCLIPGIFIVSICSVFRGFFQGLQNMVPTAVTQTVEQFIRVVAGLSLASLFIDQGVVAAACGASLGVVCGELAGFLLMLGCFFRSRSLPHAGRQRAGEAGLTREIFRLSLPVALMRLVSTGFLSLDAVLIPHRLIAAGLPTRAATGVFGQFTGIAQTLLYTPGVITVSLSTALVPAVAEALTARNPGLFHSRVNNALRLTMLTGLPSAMVLCMVAEELCGVVFGYPEAGAVLKVLALGAPFLYLQQTTTGILQGLGRPLVPFRNLVVASVFKLTGIYFLTAIPACGICGAGAAVVCGFLIMSMLNLADLRRLTGCAVEIKEILAKPLIATALAAAVLHFSHGCFAARAPQALGLLAAVALTGASYAFFVMLTGALRPGERRRFLLIFYKLFTALKR
ncbi:MAG TPA: stage V sporulation protein B [Desulfotomaculum sp.]|nr:stage V sporulation protein B [Desulfotomaculum sp.]